MPVPENEMKRVISLSEFDLDYSDIQESFGELTKLVAAIVGAEVSLINLIDSFTQWTVSHYGLKLEQMTREDSVCQYTILSKDHFEVKDLSKDDRFKDKWYVAGDPELRYYFGVPLQTADGYQLGALCVLDKMGKEIPPEKIALLKMIAAEIVKRLTDIQLIQQLRNSVKESRETMKKVAHDIRGPLSGIVNLAQLTTEQGEDNRIDEMLEVMEMIHTSGNSLLEFAEEILSPALNTDVHPANLSNYALDLYLLKDKLQKLFAPQAIHKGISFFVNTISKSDTVPFSKDKLLQIIGNLISNAIKFTPEGGAVTVDLDLAPGSNANILRVIVTDTGVGMAQEQINFILKGHPSSTSGTDGEQGHGFGMYLVKLLIDSLNGTMLIESAPGAGTRFEIVLPQSKL